MRRGCTCATIGVMDEVGVRELRQHASEVLRDVESGKSFVVTVQGRPVADLTPHSRLQWRRWSQVAGSLHPVDADSLTEDLALLGDGTPVDPWASDE